MTCPANEYLSKSEVEVEPVECHRRRHRVDPKSIERAKADPERFCGVGQTVGRSLKPPVENAYYRFHSVHCQVMRYLWDSENG